MSMLSTLALCSIAVVGNLLPLHCPDKQHVAAQFRCPVCDRRCGRLHKMGSLQTWRCAPFAPKCTGPSISIPQLSRIASPSLSAHRADDLNFWACCPTKRRHQPSVLNSSRAAGRLVPPWPWRRRCAASVRESASAVSCGCPSPGAFAAAAWPPAAACRFSCHSPPRRSPRRSLLRAGLEALKVGTLRLEPQTAAALLLYADADFHQALSEVPPAIWARPYQMNLYGLPMASRRP
jgi:hypothetical protein